MIYPAVAFVSRTVLGEECKLGSFSFGLSFSICKFYKIKTYKLSCKRTFLITRMSTESLYQCGPVALCPKGQVWRGFKLTTWN